MEDVYSLLDELREKLKDNVPTKNKKVEEDISKSNLDQHYDIDIFFSRKPGMRSSLQLISSDSDDKMDAKLSCMVAICSLCDTMVNSEILNMTEGDIVNAFLGWLEMHNIKDIEIERS